jgi:hypothetical protein
MTPGDGGLIVLGAVLGVLVFLMVSEWVPRCVQYWRHADEAQAEQVRDALAPGDIKRWDGDLK